VGIFDRKPSIDTLESEKDRLEIESEVMSKKAEVAEKEAIIRELKSRYGPGWRNILGVFGKVDLQTLRTFLKGAKEGMVRAGLPKYGSKLGEAGSSIPGKGLKRPPTTPVEEVSKSTVINPVLNPGNFRGIRRA
jgi:hypothetical protein